MTGETAVAISYSPIRTWLYDLLLVSQNIKSEERLSFRVHALAVISKKHKILHTALVLQGPWVRIPPEYFACI